LQSLVENEVMLHAYVEAHLWFALATFFLIYFLVVALSLPGAGVLSIAGGFIFGWALSFPIATLAATCGAMLVFQIVKTSLGSSLARRVSPFITKLADGFARDALSYLLFLRLVPVFPFFIINAVAGLSKVSLRVFTIATFIGIIPGAIIFAWLGRELGNIINEQGQCLATPSTRICPELTLSALVTPQIVIALTILGILALLPLAIRKWNAAS
jgi:uncharacterized membrane protein YdjX (TVP38/TMEM64 family)